MINLLPADLKQEYTYARRNSVLRRWFNYCGLGLAGVIVIGGGGLWYLQRSVNDYSRQVAQTNQVLKSQDTTVVQKQVTTISNNLQLVVKVLSKEILFSQLLARLGSVTPNSVILTNLTISQAQGAIDITAQTADYNAATQLQINLADPKNQIFSKADIVSITCNNQATNADYPCTASIRALFAANNPFLFINSKAAS